MIHYDIMSWLSVKTLWLIITWISIKPSLQVRRAEQAERVRSADDDDDDDYDDNNYDDRSWWCWWAGKQCNEETMLMMITMMISLISIIMMIVSRWAVQWGGMGLTVAPWQGGSRWWWSWCCSYCWRSWCLCPSSWYSSCWCSWCCRSPYTGV